MINSMLEVVYLLYFVYNQLTLLFFYMCITKWMCLIVIFYAVYFWYHPSVLHLYPLTIHCHDDMNTWKLYRYLCNLYLFIYFFFVIEFSLWFRVSNGNCRCGPLLFGDHHFVYTNNKMIEFYQLKILILLSFKTFFM